jgi:hypothetical protein
MSRCGRRCATGFRRTADDNRPDPAAIENAGGLSRPPAPPSRRRRVVQSTWRAQKLAAQNTLPVQPPTCRHGSGRVATPKAMKRSLLREWHGRAAYAAPRSILTRCVAPALAQFPPRGAYRTSAGEDFSCVGTSPWRPEQLTARPSDFRHPKVRHPKESQSRPQSWPVD